MSEFRCPGGFTFVHNFDSGNLGDVDFIGENFASPDSDEHYYEFNLWTRPDNAGTVHENGNRTWFYFGVKGGKINALLKMNIQMSKQSKMYSQGMTPVYRVLPGKGQWERIRERPTFSVNRTRSNPQLNMSKFSLTFKHRLQDNDKVTTFFAFTYPFSYTELQTFLNTLDLLIPSSKSEGDHNRLDDIYYHRDLLCYTIEGRRVDLLTISSYHNITKEREPRFDYLFPDLETPRAFKFDRKVVFLSARVHPGETPSSFVMNGVLNFLTAKDDPVAVALRKHFVFKVIPMLNPDGVYTGNYRTDTRGVNLNRVYLNPSPTEHPSIYGARKLLLYYHHGKEVEDLQPSPVPSTPTVNSDEGTTVFQISKLSNLEIDDDPEDTEMSEVEPQLETNPKKDRSKRDSFEVPDSGLFLYIDMHGHASKKGIFMYGNHFSNITDNIECMLFPKLVSLNSQHFHFDSCNFSERNMYLKDKKDGSSREGAGRVAVLKSTGLVRSYTLECNYNTGKMVNCIASPLREALDRKPLPILLTPPKYTPIVFEEVGRSIMWSVLDLYGNHPNSRLSNTPYRTINGVRDALRQLALADSAHSNTSCTNQKKVRNERRSRSSSRSDTGNRFRRGKLSQTSVTKCRARVVSPSSPSGSVVALTVSTKKRSKRPESPVVVASSSWRSIPRLEKKETRRLQADSRRKKLKPK